MYLLYNQDRKGGLECGIYILSCTQTASPKQFGTMDMSRYIDPRVYFN